MIRFLLPLLVFVCSTAVAAQNSSNDLVDGYSVKAMHDYWNVAEGIQNDYSFELSHSEAADTVGGGQRVVSVDKENEDGSFYRTWVLAHCPRLENEPRRLRNCRYRSVSSGLEAADDVVFDAAGAAARLRAAGVTPEAFAALVRVAPLSAGRPNPLPEEWTEVRRVQLIIAEPLTANFEQHFNTETIDSATCPAMLKPLRKLANITLEPSRVPGISNEPRFIANIPHSPIFAFSVLSGQTMITWSEGSIMSAAGHRILSSLDEMRDSCRN